MRFREGGISYGQGELKTINEQALALVVANIDVKEENRQHSRAKNKSLAEVSTYILVTSWGKKHLQCLLVRARILVLKHSIV